MVQLSFKQISERLYELKLSGFDMVIGIADGGTVPAFLRAYKLRSLVSIIRVKYRNKDNKPMFDRPKIDGKIIIPKGVQSILIVDDVSRSGKTLEMVKSYLSSFDIKTLVFVGKADYCLFPEITECVVWPWKR